MTSVRSAQPGGRALTPSVARTVVPLVANGNAMIGVAVEQVSFDGGGPATPGREYSSAIIASPGRIQRDFRMSLIPVGSSRTGPETGGHSLVCRERIGGMSERRASEFCWRAGTIVQATGQR